MSTQTDELERLTRMIRAADDALETPLQSSAPTLQRASGDPDDKRLRRAVEALDSYMRAEFLREFTAPTRDGMFHGH